MVVRIQVVGTDEPTLDACVDALSTIDAILAIDRLAAARAPSLPTRNDSADLVVAVLPPGAAAAAMLEALSGGAPLLAVLGEGGGNDEARAATRMADDFLVAPVRPSEFRCRVQRLLGAAAPPAEAAPDGIDDVARRLTSEMALAGLVGRDPAFVQMLAMIPRVARSNCPILIGGETGTGKELCARAIHSLGPRAGAPFIPADCATLPDHLFENEMFGHSSGAYTDARRDQKGLVNLADGGTLFLDEIDSLSLQSQAKLLRLLEERTYRPLGSASFLRMNASIVAATNADLPALVQRNLFRADLYFRLNVLRLRIAPLRERRGDIALLAAHLVTRICAEAGLPRKTMAPSSLRRLEALDWPGNVRELYNTIQRAALMSQGPQILPSDIFETAPAPAALARNPVGFREARSRAIESFERQYVENLMRECGGNVSHAARLAKKERRAFGRLVKRYDIAREYFDSP